MFEVPQSEFAAARRMPILTVRLGGVILKRNSPTAASFVLPVPCCKPWRLSHYVLPVVAAVAVALAGCGGSGSSATVGSTGGTTGGSTGGSSGSGATVSDTTKAADFTLITNKIKTLGSPPNFSTLPAYIKSLPGVANSQAEDDGNVTVSFQDGQWLVIFNNRTSSGPVDTTPYPPPGSKVAKTRDLPTGNTIRTIEYFAGAQPLISKITDLFSQKGYTNAVPTDASIYNLANLGFSDAVFVDTHGGSCRKLDPTDPTRQKTVKEFGMITNSLAPYKFANGTFTPLDNVSRDPTIDADIKQGIVGFAMDNGNLLLAVLPEFLQPTWKFPPNSIIINSVCESDTSLSQNYNQMCIGNSAGAFFGYDNEVLGEDAANDAQQVFEGLLGTHIYNPGMRGRAWNVSSYFNGMKSAGKTKHIEFINGASRVCNLTYEPGSGSFTGLCPGIQYMYVKEFVGQLVIVGDFGSATGKVTINGTALPVTNWTTSQITCTVPSDPNDASFSGPVVVTYNGHDSNEVNLTKYVGTVHYEHDDEGSLKHTADMKLYMRADVHPYRTQPFATPTRPATPMTAVNSSTFNYNSSGTYTVDTATYAWTGSGTLPNGGFVSAQSVYSASMTLNYAAQNANFVFDFSVMDGYTQTINGMNPGPIVLNADTQVFTTANPPTILLTTDNSLNIKQYNGPHVPAGVGSPATCFVNATFTATPAPDNTNEEDNSD